MRCAGALPRSAAAASNAMLWVMVLVSGEGERWVA